jgi:predicted RNA binding protein YcfA (HicA-like mRNA interferase family)
MFNKHEIKKALEKKGFKEIDRTKHIKYIFYKDNLPTSVSTMISKGTKPLSKNLISQMAREVELKNHQFYDLIKCPLSKEALIQILEEKKIL